MIALVVTVLTLGTVQVEWDGVGATARGVDERPAIGATLDGDGERGDGDARDGAG